MHTDIILTPCLTASGLWYNMLPLFWKSQELQDWNKDCLKAVW